ncbi:YceI family protein [Mucilaginibacter sp. HD30]
MKKLFMAILSLLSFTAFSQKHTVDAKNSSLTWTGHAQTGVYSPKGTLAIKSGTLTFSGSELTGGTVTVNMTSLKTDNAEMQEHLRNKDFFDVEKFPEATLALKSVSGNAAKGTLTIKGITQPIVFDLQLGKGTVHATATIDRTLYGIKYNSASYFQDLGSYAIRNTFEIDITLVTL